jgi:hypothetical protein
MLESNPHATEVYIFIDDSQAISGDAIANYLLYTAVEIFNFRAYYS